MLQHNNYVNKNWNIKKITGHVNKMDTSFFKVINPDSWVGIIHDCA